MKMVLGILVLVYLTGVVLFTFYAAMMSKGWNDRYSISKSIAFGVRWPLLILGFDRRR